MMRTNPFKGANVFMSRNLVPPEVFDALLDALKQNGAEVFLCCDPSRAGPNDYHVISSPDHEKFEDLRTKGCNLLGPQCILSCAKENRALPKQGFTCCFAMEGAKILASGFEMAEKVKIGKLVMAMGGMLHAKTSPDISFVIVKNVLAAKYKRALFLKKPIVTINWLYQCWNQHRVVPQESYRVLPFSGLTICVTRIPADERKEIQKLIMQNGGKYSAELTKKCTHLICDTPEGDKYKVARRWGNINIVTRKWLDQSIVRRACLDEESYPVGNHPASSNRNVRGCLIGQQSQEIASGVSISAPSSAAAESTLPAATCAGFSDPDLEATLSQNISSMFPDGPVLIKEDSEAPVTQPTNETNLDGCVANDSQSEDSDLYLSECRISLVGFEASETRKLLNMVRRGGGSRYVSLSNKLTHIIVGTPSEGEKKEVRSFAAFGNIRVVRTSWLEDCDREKKEIPVLQKHVAHDLLLPKDSVLSVKGTVSIKNISQGRNSSAHQSGPSDQLLREVNTGFGTSLMEKTKEEKPEINNSMDSSVEAVARFSQQSLLPILNNRDKGTQNMQHDSAGHNSQNGKKPSVFKGKKFRFSNAFPDDRKAEIVQWVNQGGGEFVDDHTTQTVHFTIECHGVTSGSAVVPKTTFVSSHWVRSCLEDGCLLDVGSHILYSPLPCQIPLPGFESFRFCVSQYEEKDRLLLRNLCFVLGAKFVEKLTKKVTHLLCKFTSGPKYEAARKWGIHPVMSEWIYECVRQNQIVSIDPFCPREVTAQDKEAGLFIPSQFLTQANQMISGENLNQLQSQDIRNTATQTSGSINDNSGGSRSGNYRKEENQSSSYCKRARLQEDGAHHSELSSGGHPSDPIHDKNSGGDNIAKHTGEASRVVPDVAAAIEDLLEQTTKIHDQKSPERTDCENSFFSSDCSVLCQDHRDSVSVIGLSRHWLNRSLKKDDICSSPGKDNAAIYDGFSETQTDSQVVGYEEDLTGRQMLIDRVRTRSSMT